MAFFGNYTEDNNVTLENSAKYENELGLGVIALECAQFDSELFTECVKSDIQEYQVVQEGGDLETFQEGAWENIKTKVVAFYRKIKEKVKAFFRGWYAKIAARIVSDNKAFYNKYKKVVDEKVTSGLEIAWFKNYSTLTNTITKIEVTSFDDLVKAFDKDDVDPSDIIEKIYEKFDSNISSHAELKKAAADKVDDDIEEDYDFVKASKDIIDLLSSGDKLLKDAEKEFNKSFSKLDKAEKDLVKNNKNAKNIAAIAHNHARAEVTVLEVKVAFYKRVLKMARIAFAKAVAYKPKTEGSIDLLNVEADAIEFLG